MIASRLHMSDIKLIAKHNDFDRLDFSAGWAGILEARAV